MNKLYTLLVLCFSVSIFAADISPVTSGDGISAQKFNELITELNIAKKQIPNLGSVQTSFLPLSSFQKLNGSCWALANGSSVTGSDYGNFLASEGLPVVSPDMRGTVARMKDHGRGLNPDGDLALGQYQGDMFASHSHTANYGGTAGNGNFVQSTVNDTGLDNNPLHPSGGNETRAKSTTVNFFIKINKTCNFP